MRSRFAFQEPQNVEATIEITMTVKEWRELLKQFDTTSAMSHPAYSFQRHVGEAINKAEESIWVHFQPEPADIGRPVPHHGSGPDNQ